jgi:hypothetical protein
MPALLGGGVAATDVSPAPPPPPWNGAHTLAKSAAILYHGEYYRTEEDDEDEDSVAKQSSSNHGWRRTAKQLQLAKDLNDVSKCSDFFSAADNHKHTIIEPLRRVGIEYIVTAFHSFTSGHKARDQALVNFLQPVAYNFSKSFDESPRIVDSYLKVIDLLQRSKERVDIALVIRFDLFMLKPIDWLSVEWSKVNFRDRDYYWRCRADDESDCAPSDLHFASDLFFLTPTKYLPALRSSLDDSGKRTPKNPDFAWLKGSGHWTYDPLAKRIGKENIHFITGGWRTSMSDAQHVCDWQFYAGESGMYTKEDEPIGVLRVCPIGKNKSEPILQTCINWKEVVNGSDKVGLAMHNGFSTASVAGKPIDNELEDGNPRSDPRRKRLFDAGKRALLPHSDGAARANRKEGGSR